MRYKNHRIPLSRLLLTTLMLSACGGNTLKEQDYSDIPRPESLIPLPPPGGFSELAEQVVQTRQPEPRRESGPEPTTPEPPAKPAITAASQPSVVSSGISRETLPVSQALVPDEKPASEWISRYPALAEEYSKYKQTLQRLEQDYRHYVEQVEQLHQRARRYWGKENVHESGSDKYVKYGEGYTSRGEVDFAKGNVVVETVESHQHKQRLQKAIVTTLLTPDNARDPNLFSDQSITYRGPSVLEGQIRDHDGVIVKWEWRANRYADWLVENKLQQVNANGRTIYRVEIPMEENHQQVRGQKYESLVRKSAKQYGVSESLIYSIMETESHFNPYATSHIPAYGLMQVVPSTAGRDVFKRVKKRNDQPTRSYLFNPANNIDTGTAYLNMLDELYLKDVKHPLAREYCVISAYNGGAGNVLRTFSRDRKHAVKVINSLTPQQVYVKLNRSHPRAEARKYIEKVVKAKKRYDSMAVAHR